MSVEKLLKENPLSTEVINNWFTKQMLESIKTDDVPDEFKEYVIQKGVDLDQIIVFINVNPRCLFDMLDGYDVIIQIVHTEDHGFGFRIDDYTELDSETRKDAEFDALKKGLKLLESKLSKSKKIT